MARYEASPFGRIRGKVGEAVGEYWKGIKYMKGYTTPTDRKSQKQLNVRWLWFIIGSLYGLYHSRLKDNNRSGMQNLPLLEEDYQTYLRLCIRQAQNSIVKISSLKFNRSETDFDKSHYESERFTDMITYTPIVTLDFYNGMDFEDYTFKDSDYKATLILFDVANKKTWCYAINDGLEPYDDVEDGTFRGYHGKPFEIEEGNYFFGFMLFEVTGTRRTDNKRIRRWSYDFYEYGEIWESY